MILAFIIIANEHVFRAPGKQTRLRTTFERERELSKKRYYLTLKSMRNFTIFMHFNWNAGTVCFVSKHSIKNIL
jgi:hypothetical protein